MTALAHAQVALAELRQMDVYKDWQHKIVTGQKTVAQFNLTHCSKCEQELLSTIADLSAAPVPADPKTARWWSSTSPWNKPIPTDAPVHPNSAAMVQMFQANYGPVFDPSYGVNVYFADVGTPKRTCHVTRYPGSLGTTVLVPVPLRVLPTTGSDHKWAVLEPDGTLWEVWGAYQRSDGDWDVGSIGKTNVLSGTGWYKDGTTGAYASAVGGLLRGVEMAAGKIEHALAVALPIAAVANSFVPPALKTDGTAGGMIPEGARLQLDPTFNVGGLSAWAQPIARAMQTYGLYVVDKGGAISVTIEGGDSPANYGWPAAKGDMNAMGIKGHLRVLAW